MCIFLFKSLALTQTQINSNESTHSLIIICVDSLPLAYSAGHKSRGRKLADVETFQYFYTFL